MSRRSIEERFWIKVDRRGPDECWPWVAALAGGYGAFMVSHGHMTCAHRFVYELLVGPIPEGLTLDHLCHTNDEGCPGGPTCLHRRCVNPAHLEPVTMRVNLLRGRSPSARHARKTHCPQGHPFDEANTYPDSRGQRGCRACRTESNRKQRERKRRAA